MTWRGTMRVVAFDDGDVRAHEQRPNTVFAIGCDHEVEAPTRELARAKAIKEHKERCEK
jgi:hypothetical protein